MSVAERYLPHSIYRALRTQRVRRQIRHFESRTHRGTYCGHELALRLEDPLAEGWYGHDWPVLPEFDVLKERGILRPGARVFDLGAHQGVIALVFASEVGAGGQVVAVEAEPHNAEVARRNVALNESENVAVLQAAVTDSEGSVPFAVSLNGRVDERSLGNVRVPAVTIDSLAEQYGMPDVVFLDIEGYEGYALQAADRVLASDATFFVEVHTDRLAGASAEEIVAKFDGRELLVATEPGGDEATHSFRAFEGEIPEERFYLIAVALDRFDQ